MAGLVRAGFSFAKNAIFSTTVRSIATTRQLGLKEIRERNEGSTVIVEGVTIPSPRTELLIRAENIPGHEVAGVPSEKPPCYMCALGLDVKHTDVLILSQFVRTDGCMLPRRITGLCRRQQKKMGKLVAMAQKADSEAPEIPNSVVFQLIKFCHCGEAVDGLGHHGLSCSRSAGRISRHAHINDIIRRALLTAGVPAVLEPNGLVRDDGKRPDGMSLLPWKMGRPLVWDATCVDTLAPSHLPSTAGCAGAAAASAETLKRRLGNYIFEPFGVETLGSWGPSARMFYKELGRRLIDTSRDQKAGLFFAQRISIAIQRGNAASLLGTLPADSDSEEYYDA